MESVRFWLAALCWQKSLLCNVFTRMLLYPESTLQLGSSRRFCEVFKEVYFDSLSAVRWRGLPSGHSSISNIRPDDVVYCPEAHLSTVPAIRTMCHTVWTPDRPSIIRLDPPLYREASVRSCVGPDVSAARSDNVQWSISFRFSFQVQIREDWCNRPDDVDSRPDALIHKARIVIQTQQSGRLSAWSGHTFNIYGNCGFNFNRPDACLSWAGRARNKYGNCVLKINCPDGHPPGPDAWILIWKLLAVDVRPSVRWCLTVRMPKTCCANIYLNK
jgi:hypothetical protein